MTPNKEQVENSTEGKTQIFSSLLLPGSVQTLRGSPESSPAGRPDSGAEAPTSLQQQREEEEELAVAPCSSSHSLK